MKRIGQVLILILIIPYSSLAVEKDEFGLVPGQKIDITKFKFNKVDVSKFDNKQCNKMDGYIHRDTLTLHEICKQKHGVCPDGKPRLKSRFIAYHSTKQTAL